jgi:peptidyl-prolyl cis-trans isomerase SurA
MITQPVRFLLVLTLLLAAARPGFSQQAPQRCDTAQSVDRVIAVVGTAPILASYVDETAYQSIAQQGIQLPDSEGALRAYCRRVLQEIIDVELLVQRAQEDTAIKVTDQEVAEGVDQQVKNVRGKFVSEVEYRNELRKAGFENPEEYRRWLSDQQRREALKNRLLDKLQGEHKLSPVIPTEKEMRQAFDERKAELGERPATVSFKQIVVSPQADTTARLHAFLLADSIAKALRHGGDFAQAAKRFSEDPTTKDQGGDLGWFRRGMMVQSFEQVAFSLKPGVVSAPVETIFGFHVIQVQRVQPGEIQARHILIMPDITPAEADSAQALAERVRTAVLNGASIDSLQRLFNDPTLDQDATDVSLSRLPAEFQTAIGQADSGTVVPLFKLPGPVSYRDKYIVLKLMNRRSAGEVRYEDVKDQIRSGLGKDLAVKHYVAQLRRSAYVEIRGF